MQQSKPAHEQLTQYRDQLANDLQRVEASVSPFNDCLDTAQLIPYPSEQMTVCSARRGVHLATNPGPSSSINSITSTLCPGSSHALPPDHWSSPHVHKHVAPLPPPTITHIHTTHAFNNLGMTMHTLPLLAVTHMPTWLPSWLLSCPPPGCHLCPCRSWTWSPTISTQNTHRQATYSR
jgi:hypothetical protein